jgi:tetratricopeptide (TPR) repeat protein
MSFLRRLWGGRSAAEERAEADRLFQNRSFFEARQAYERALDRARDDADLRAHCEARLAACADALAEQRIEEAARLREGGELDLARAELATAIELARSPAVREKALRAAALLEGRDAVEQATETELSDDERWAVIAGTWDQAQMDEYDAYGEDFRAALLALHDGRVKEARRVLERLAEEHADDAVYLWVEVGRARFRDEDEEGCAQALRRFLERVDEDDRSQERLQAHLVLCALADKAGDEEKAIEWLHKAVDAMPDDPRAYLQLGAFLRQKGYPEEAIEVLEAAIDRMDGDRPSWEAYQELGLAKRDAGHDEDAIELLEKVIHFFVTRSHLDFPPSAALPLAQLYEKLGRKERAADLYRSLASGSDRANHLQYHLEAARVLSELGLLAEARRMLTRAAALAESKPDVVAAVEAQIAEIDRQL